MSGVAQDQNNMTNTQAKTWGELPEEIRLLLSAESTVDAIERIAQKQGLPPMEQGFLVRICANLMRGNIPPTAFVDTISDELDVPREKAAYLAQEVNRDVFILVKDALKKVHEKPSSVQKIDPSLVTCLPGEMSPTAVAGNKAPGNTIAAGSIFEQKLGGAFRMKGEVATSTGGTTIPSPTLVTPPAPQAIKPATTAFDPYRELPH
jgi:hypothetical protein